MIVLSFLVIGFFCYNNGVGRLPPMGWNTWNQFKCSVNESLMLRTAEGFIKYGLDKVGYEYVNIDDCWQSYERDEKGAILVDLEKFPDMKGLSEKIHSMGLKFGLYTAIGTETCEGRMGSLGYFEQDAASYKDWNVDFIKVDCCNQPLYVKEEPWAYYQRFSKAINKTGQRMIYLIGSPGTKTWEWPIPPASYGHMWRISHDIDTRWGRIKEIIDVMRDLYPFTGPYGYNDPDMVEVGVHGTMKPWNDDMNKVHFSFWCLFSAPLILGLDLTGDVPQEVLDVILNEDAISIDQDELVYQGRVVQVKYTQVWSKEMVGGKKAVLFFNRHCNRYPRYVATFSVLHFGLMIFTSELIIAGCWCLFKKKDEFVDFANIVFLLCCVLAVIIVFVVAYLNSIFNLSEVMEVKWSELGIQDNTETYQIRDVWKKQDLGVFAEKFTTERIGVDACVLIIMTPV